MHFSKFLAITALLATSAVAVPTSPTKPEKPKGPPPGSNQQGNTCGNGATPYCCDTDNFGKYTVCKTFASVGGTCSTTTVCCNANNSIQICLGNAAIV